MSTTYQIVVCGSIVPDPLQTLEPITGPTGPALKNEMLLPGRANPHHTRLPNLIGHNLTGMPHAVRWQLAGVIERLYKLRVVAD